MLRKLIFTYQLWQNAPLLNAIRAAGTYLSNDPGNTGTACTGSGSYAPRARTRIWGAGTWLRLCNPSSAILQTVLQSQKHGNGSLRAPGLVASQRTKHRGISAGDSGVFQPQRRKISPGNTIHCRPCSRNPPAPLLRPKTMTC